MDKNSIAAKALIFLSLVAGTACAAGLLPKPSSPVARPALPAIVVEPAPVTETPAPAEAEIQAALQQTDGC